MRVKRLFSDSSWRTRSIYAASRSLRLASSFFSWMREIIVGDGGRSRVADLAGDPGVEEDGVAAAADLLVGVAVFFVRLDIVYTAM